MSGRYFVPCRALAKIPGKFGCIASSEEKYIGFTKDIKVDTYKKWKCVESEGVKTFVKDTKETDINIQLRFIDSMRFMAGSLESHIYNRADIVKFFCCDQTNFDLVGIDGNYCAQMRCKKCGKIKARQLEKKTLVKSFASLSNYVYNERGDSNADEQFRLLLTKGVFPYEYIDSWHRFEETTIPSQKSYYHRLKLEECSDDDYSHVHKMWKAFDHKNIGDDNNLYVRSDVLLLNDIFEGFRELSIKTYGLDPCHYYSAPGFTWDAGRKMTKVKLELITDQCMFEMVEKNIRGGVVMVRKRYIKSNNKYMGKEYNPRRLSIFAIYDDANNLYGKAMMFCLPTGDFAWNTEKWSEERITALDAEASTGYIFEVDLTYPKELHDSHKDYPFCPEHMIINEQRKLTQTPGLVRNILAGVRQTARLKRSGRALSHANIARQV